MLSCTRVLSEDISSVDTKISLTVFGIALLASIALFFFETRKRASHKKIIPLERVTSVPGDPLEDTQTEASEITLLSETVQQRARTLYLKDDQPPSCHPQEPDLNDAVVEDATASSECAPCSPKGSSSTTKRPQNRWTSIEYQRQAQNKLLFFIRSVSGITESKQDQEVKEETRSDTSLKSSEVPRIETCLPSVSEEVVIIRLSLSVVTVLCLGTSAKHGGIS